ncbi:hypothetical protein AMATHDRAFT_62975 [Amanita thiersii Skay4041]|uniref:F-box domain-containing protein n=1 Tax=Amanita thiersii Skay4041 TaxID=703135 RepID=A0A2A9NMH7_9AGAR|nr:hypothetical protein AMATHDRAFT_62975 [Amanita thiersii Skay4041]
MVSNRKTSSLAQPRTQTRRSVHIDTNLAIYDAADPFNALNVLLKLLGLLPSRAGSSQYKFSPDEHVLSIHLISIIESYVGVAAPPQKQRTLTRQPTEVLDTIAFNLDSKNDLLSLALTCKRMHDIIFPRHYHYRTIRCKLSALRVWNHLSVHRSLARNVRRLEIMDERASSISDGSGVGGGTKGELVPPGIVTTETDLESTDDELGMHEKHSRFLIKAVSKMKTLREFAWGCNHTPTSISDLWSTLVNCQWLQVIEVRDNMAFWPTVESDSDSDLSTMALVPAVLSETASVTFRSTQHAYGSSKHPSLRRILGMLESCPRLKSLDVSYTTPRNPTGAPPPPSRPSVDELLLSSRWTSLTSLSLTNLRCSPTTGASSLSSFLAAHSNLEVLHLDISPNWIEHTARGASASIHFTLPPGSLPCLREVRAHRDAINAILECPSSSPRPLETLTGFRLTAAWSKSKDRTFLLNLARHSTSIRKIEMTGWNEIEDVRQLVECVPHLTWLDIGKKLGSSSKNPINQAAKGAQNSSGCNTMPSVTNATEWAELLSTLPELTAFHGVRFFYEISPQALAASIVDVGGGSSQASIAAAAAGISMVDRSRLRKNDETAGVLAWKCPKLRRLDHWEGDAGKVIILLREGERRDGLVRWEVRRVRQ